MKHHSSPNSAPSNQEDQATHIKQTRTLNILLAPDETAEHRHITKEHENLYPMKTTADLTREMHKLSTHN